MCFTMIYSIFFWYSGDIVGYIGHCLGDVRFFKSFFLCLNVPCRRFFRVNCQEVGITVRMVTGDNDKTITAIAMKCGILDADSDYVVMEGKQFNAAVRDAHGKIIQDKVLEVEGFYGGTRPYT